MRHIKPYQELFEDQGGATALTKEQISWLNGCRGTGFYHASSTEIWKLNSQTGLVDVDGHFNCGRQDLTDFKGIRFGHVKGNFYCDENQLTSLEGAPRSVDGNFYCNLNQLTSLVGAPKSVGGSFYCGTNELTSLVGAPESVNRSFWCSSNSLTSLKGAPQEVGGDFVCDRNSLTSLEGSPQRVGGYLFCYDNPISETGITNVIRRMSDHNVSLEQAVSGRWKTGKWDEITEEDKPYLAKHNPDLTPEEKREYAALERLKKRII